MASPSREREITREETALVVVLNCQIYEYLRGIGLRDDAVEAFRQSVNQHRDVSQLLTVLRNVEGVDTNIAEELFPRLHAALIRFDSPVRPSTPLGDDKISSIVNDI